MATNIPPHNPEEGVRSAVRLLDALVDSRELSTRELCRTTRPDFPTGARSSLGEELEGRLQGGQGSIRLRHV
jgi:DNA gyrase/topoisomerase IV subunit A